MRAIDEFRALPDFEAEVGKGSMVAYMYGFQAVKAQVIRMFPRVDVGHLDPIASEDEAEEKD